MSRRFRLLVVLTVALAARIGKVWIVRAARARRWRAAAIAGLAMAALAVGSSRLLEDIATRERYRAAEFVLAAQVYVRRGEPDPALGELRAGLAKLHPSVRPTLSPADRQMAEGLAEIAHRLGRDAEVTADLERLSADYPGDTRLQHLLR